MDPQLKQRLVGAAVLLSLAVIFLPLILSGPPPGETEVVRKEIPPRPDDAGDFESRVLPLTAPKLNAPVTKVVVGDDADDAPENLPDPIPEPPPSTRAGVAPDAAPDAAPGVVAESSSAPSDATRAGLLAWAIQVGSFSSEENALTLSQDLRKAGYSAFTQNQINSKGRKIWFVRVGPVLERAEADKLVARLRAKRGFKDAYVVRYP